MNDKSYYIPREFNQNYFLIWKRDEALFLFMPWVLWLVFPGLLGLGLSLILMIVVGQLLRQVGTGRPNGYIKHWLEFNVAKVFTHSSFKNRLVLTQKKSWRDLLVRKDTFPPAHIRYIGG